MGSLSDGVLDSRGVRVFRNCFLAFQFCFGYLLGILVLSLQTRPSGWIIQVCESGLGNILGRGTFWFVVRLDVEDPIFRLSEVRR